MKINKILTTTKANIYKLGYEYSNLTSSNSEYSSGNSNFQFHNKPTSFSGPKNVKTYRENSVKIPGVTIPTGVVLQKGI